MMSDTVSTPTPTPTTPILHLQPIPWSERPSALKLWRTRSLSALLDEAQAESLRTLYLIAGPYAAEKPARDWWLAPAADGWHISNYVSDKTPQARYWRAGVTIDVRTTAPWFGHAFDAPRVFVAWRLLGRLVRGMFDNHAPLMGTPARTGLDLLQRSLPLRGVYPVAPDEVRALIRANIGQGRFEFLPTTARRGDLTWMDGRWMYAGCVSHLPVGDMRYDKTKAYIEHVPAFYFCRWRAPLDWPYPLGLLPELTGNEDDGPRFRYPWDGRWHCGWVTGAEFELARSLGWELRISERITWDMSQPDPTRNWADKLRRMRTYTSDDMVAYGVRHILIDAVGAFSRVARRELHATPVTDDASIPDDAYDFRRHDDIQEWHMDGQLPRDLLAFQHPEWSATVWGRTRVRLLKSAIRYCDMVPQGQIAAFRSDAFVVTHAPDWIDDGRIGTFRAKRKMWHVAIPTREAEYRELLREEAEEEEIG